MRGARGAETAAEARGAAASAAEAAADPAGLEADPESVARKVLLDLLSVQARSRAELEERLARRRVPTEVADRVLTRFQEVGLIDDEAFANAWVQSRQAGKGLARRALAQELRRKGIDDETARQALDHVGPDAEAAAARALVRRRLRSVERLDRVAATRRLTAMLSRKGYSAGVSFRVVREELEAVSGGAWGMAESAPEGPVPTDFP